MKLKLFTTQFSTPITVKTTILNKEKQGLIELVLDRVNFILLPITIPMLKRLEFMLLKLLAESF
jgi:hypothetical protein